MLLPVALQRAMAGQGTSQPPQSHGLIPHRFLLCVVLACTGDSGESGDQGLGSMGILRLKSTGFADGLDIGCERDQKRPQGFQTEQQE